MTCPTCGHAAPGCPVCGAAPAGPLGGSCPACIDADSKRLDALAAALGCDRSEVNPTTLGVAAKIAKCEWHEVTPEKIVGKLTVTRAAVATVLDGTK